MTRRFVGAAAVAALLLAGTASSTADVRGSALVPDTAAAPSCDPDAPPAWVTQPGPGARRVGAPDVWRAGGNVGVGVLVAVVDSGVEDRNPHLKDAVRPGASFVADDLQPDGTTDVANHGTAVASIIAARQVEPSALVGVAPGAMILPVRYYQSTDEESVNEGKGPEPGKLAQSIVFAADHGARIINVSSSQPTPDERLEAAVRYAQEAGALVVASAGNDPGNRGADTVRFPAGYSGVLGVTAVDVRGDVSDAVVHGPAVDLAAPGQEVPVALLAGRDCVEATGGGDPAASWATAFVSGAAALVWSAHPDESAEQIAYRLTSSADRPVRAQRDDTRGWGVVNAYEAVVMTPDPARAGPPLPGASAPVVQETVPPVDTGDSLVDPLAGARAAVVRWGLLGAAGLGLLLLLTRWNRLATGRARPDRLTP